MAISIRTTDAPGTRATNAQILTVQDAMQEIAQHRGQTVLVLSFITALPEDLLTSSGIDPEFNTGMPASLAVAQWQADTAWASPKTEATPKQYGVDNVVTTYDASMLPKSKSIVFKTS